MRGLTCGVELLFYTFSGARIFFQSDEDSDAAATVDGKTEEKKGEKAAGSGAAPPPPQTDKGEAPPMVPGL